MKLHSFVSMKLKKNKKELKIYLRKALRKNKRTGPNKERTGEKLDLKKINVHVRLFGSREYTLQDIKNG